MSSDQYFSNDTVSTSVLVEQIRQRDQIIAEMAEKLRRVEEDNISMRAEVAAISGQSAAAEDARIRKAKVVAVSQVLVLDATTKRRLMSKRSSAELEELLEQAGLESAFPQQQVHLDGNQLRLTNSSSASASSTSYSALQTETELIPVTSVPTAMPVSITAAASTGKRKVSSSGRRSKSIKRVTTGPLEAVSETSVLAAYEDAAKNQQQQQVEQDYDIEDEQNSVQLIALPCESTAVAPDTTAKKPKSRPVCEHGKQRYICKDCGGAGICEHGKEKRWCRDCGGSGFCKHGKIKALCKDGCVGSKICEHGSLKRNCKDCGGSGICGHGKQKYNCKDCGGAGICEHGKHKHMCRLCMGSSICAHGKRSYDCKECGGAGICEHGRLRCSCRECGGGNRWCEHGKRRIYCKYCGGSGLCEHDRYRCICKICGGSAICEHRKVRYLCVACGGAGLCEHRLPRGSCRKCRKRRMCSHQQLRNSCDICREEEQQQQRPAANKKRKVPVPTAGSVENVAGKKIRGAKLGVKASAAVKKKRAASVLGDAAKGALGPEGQTARPRGRPRKRAATVAPPPSSSSSSPSSSSRAFAAPVSSLSIAAATGASPLERQLDHKMRVREGLPEESARGGTWDGHGHLQTVSVGVGVRPRGRPRKQQQVTSGDSSSSSRSDHASAYSVRATRSKIMTKEYHSQQPELEQQFIEQPQARVQVQGQKRPRGRPRRTPSA